MRSSGSRRRGDHGDGTEKPEAGRRRRVLSRYSGEGACEGCGARFRWFLLDAVRNESGYAYCDACGATALVSAAPPGPVDRATSSALSACACGGRFRAGAGPRCPACRAELSAEAARDWIERHATRGREDWDWQGTWEGRYCIVIENRLTTEG